MFVVELALIGAALALLPLGWILWRVRSDRYRKLAWLTMFLTLDLVMFGAFTRLTDSGLGCPDWPGCYASSSPFAAHASIAAAYAAMPSGPVSVMKAWIEMIHRYFAMAIGLLIVLMTGIAWIRRWRGQPLPASPWWPTALLALVLVQGAFGAWTVTLKLQPVIVTTHLLLGLGLLAALGLFAARMTPAPQREPSTGRGFAAALIALALLIVQIALGGWVSTNYAVLACTDFPTCNGQWVPPMDFAQGFHLWRALGLNANGEVITQDALVAIHWTHRAFAMVVIVYLLGWAWRIRRLKGLTRLADGVLAVVVLQFLTGLSNIVLQWPLPIAVAHNGGAAILLLLVVMLNWRIASSRTVVASSASSSAVTA
ncbi:COX15/CtaA family protein [Mycetohabitans rhizoxinica]|uniref:COX15/CtaA family protein n=1 Tax=Mycetohabitans rhizoxinica TaxID=412963 RepID=UPI0030CC2ED2